ncbi:MAG: response regulator transcription factor [Spirochaetes bacterium]|nr:response regulator transcription factor [Spirochaetota bacterium]
MPEALRILLGDDDALIREALEILFSADPAFRLVAVVDNGRDAVRHCLGGGIDVALLDIRMPVLDGIAAAAEICAASNCRVLLLSTFREEELVRAALASGASGYLLKGCSSSELKEAVRLVSTGHTVFNEEIFAALRSAPRPVQGDLSVLSEREQQLVRLVAEGYSNRQAAEALFLSEGTIKNYISSILDKLGLRQRTQIAVYYMTGRRDFS